MTTWADVKKGSVVELAGKTYRVDKIKPKGKVVKVTVSHRGDRFSHEVAAKGAVTLVSKNGGGVDFEKLLHDADGRQQRWASESEVEPPRKSSKPSKPGGAWDDPKGKAEKAIAKLGGTLVAEGRSDGPYSVPPVDVTTVRAHWMLFHEGDVWRDLDEAALLQRHAAFHAQPEDEQDHLIHHTHTKERP